MLKVSVWVRRVHFLEGEDFVRIAAEGFLQVRSCDLTCKDQTTVPSRASFMSIDFWVAEPSKFKFFSRNIQTRRRRPIERPNEQRPFRVPC